MQCIKDRFIIEYNQTGENTMSTVANKKTFFIGNDGSVEIYVKIANTDSPSDQDVLIKRWPEFDEEMPIFLIKQNITHPRGADRALNWITALSLYLQARK